MELAVKRMFLGMLNSGVQAVRGGPEDRRPMTVDREEEEEEEERRLRHGRGRSRAGRRRAGRSYFAESDKSFSSSQSL